MTSCRKEGEGEDARPPQAQQKMLHELVAQQGVPRVPSAHWPPMLAPQQKALTAVMAETRTAAVAKNFMVAKWAKSGGLFVCLWIWFLPKVCAWRC